MIDFVILIWGGRYARFCALMMITQALVRFYEAPWQQQPLTASTSKKSAIRIKRQETKALDLL